MANGCDDDGNGPSQNGVGFLRAFMAFRPFCAWYTGLYLVFVEFYWVRLEFLGDFIQTLIAAIFHQTEFHSHLVGKRSHFFFNVLTEVSEVMAGGTPTPMATSKLAGATAVVRRMRRRVSRGLRSRCFWWDVASTPTLGTSAMAASGSGLKSSTSARSSLLATP